jgi:hypothetical protein
MMWEGMEFFVRMVTLPTAEVKVKVGDCYA